MKSERRHELQHNQLADSLAATATQVKPYARLIGGLFVLLAVLGVAYAYVNTKNEEQASAGWDQYFEAVSVGDRGQLATVADRFAGTSVAPWARIAAADIALIEGSATLFQDKAKARDLLRQAVDNYQTVLNDPRDEMLKQRALFGLGRAHESLATVEDLDKAREDYKKLIASYPQGVYKQAAEGRLADIDKNSTKEFYDWFAKYEPVKSAAPTGKSPEFIEENLERDIKLPTSLDDIDLGIPSTSDSPTSPAATGDRYQDDVELPSTSADDSKTSAETPASPAESQTPPPADPSSNQPEK
jgi:tetratricopeptide (TPR) repeat protein